MRIKFLSILVVIFLQASWIETQEIQISNFPGNLIGVWPESYNVKGAVEKEFSWGVGLITENSSIVFDYDLEGNLYVDNPGLGRYLIESFKYLTQNKVELQLRKQNIKMLKSIPNTGSIIITFVSEKEIIIDDSGYVKMFGAPGEKIYKRLSPP